MRARTRVRRRRLAALVVGATLAAAVSGQVANAMNRHDGSTAHPAGRTRTYVVRPGDTLWSIASHLEPSEDPRLVVHRITGSNDLDPGALVPGQEIVVPAG